MRAARMCELQDMCELHGPARSTRCAGCVGMHELQHPCELHGPARAAGPLRAARRHTTCRTHTSRTDLRELQGRPRRSPSERGPAQRRARAGCVWAAGSMGPHAGVPGAEGGDAGVPSEHARPVRVPGSHVGPQASGQQASLHESRVAGKRAALAEAGQECTSACARASWATFPRHSISSLDCAHPRGLPLGHTGARRWRQGQIANTCPSLKSRVCSAPQGPPPPSTGTSNLLAPSPAWRQVPQCIVGRRGN